MTTNYGLLLDVEHTSERMTTHNGLLLDVEHTSERYFGWSFSEESDTLGGVSLRRAML
jgi:hypothetical protein